MPGLWQQQLFPPSEEARGAISSVLQRKLATGSDGTSGHFVRGAQVFGLADLFRGLGAAHTAADLYELFLSVRAFAYVRARTRP